MKNLVIVESPTKAKTISKFLPKEFKVESSFGHVRDLPKKELGVDVEGDYTPTYVIPEKAKNQVAKLKALAKDVDNIILATDEDREGEAISWHLLTILKPKRHQRIAFHEITKDAILHAIKNPRELDMNIVDAQQARRVLDRLVGYKLSPFLWAKVARGLSAGRVQSVAVRLIVERERERQTFNQEEYWTIEATFKTTDAKETISAKLYAIDDKSLDKFAITNETQARDLVDLLQKEKWTIAKIESKEQNKKPPTPFKTSTLQQAANNKLNFSAKQTMRLAQQLYEGIKVGNDSVGLITYMRTDSLNLSTKYLDEAHAFIKKEYGKEYAPDKPVQYKTKKKDAQEAHEAVRPTDVTHTPESIKQYLDPKQYKLYKLIWSRTLASQMSPAVVKATSLTINDAPNKHSFRATGQIITFPGFYKVYSTAKETILPNVKENDPLALETITPDQHFTQPPARYTEASLVKVLEEYGIGRPSTYAPTISTIQDRGYISKEEKALKPEDMAFLVNDILVKHFPQIVDYDFTAKMEDDLDLVEAGKKKWIPLIKNFFIPFEKNLEKKTKELTKKELTEEETDEVCEKCGHKLVIKTGRFGRFLACTNYPDCKNTKNIGSNNEPEEPEKLIDTCPECGSNLVKRHGRFGEFIGCSNYPDCKYIQKKEVSTGVHCPQCEKGEIVTKRTKKSKIFFACNQYPDCKYALWSKPTGEKCTECNSLMIQVGKGPKDKCSNAECKTNPQKDEAQDNKIKSKEKSKAVTKKKKKKKKKIT